MNRPLAAVPILAIVCIVGIFVWGFIQTSPEPFALPPTNVAVPLSSTETVQGDVLHVVVDNLTGVPISTALQPTPVSNTPIPYCPVTPHQICQIPPAVVVVTPTEPIICDATAMPLMSPGVVCVWRIAPTFVPTPTPGGVFR